MERKGLLIAFEGIDGTGKTTQIELLAEILRQRGLSVVATREPTDGQYGRKIRELYKNRKSVTPEEELALFLDDRREHVAQVIAPALASGKVVLTDRYYYSTAAYQGAAGHDPQKSLPQMNCLRRCRIWLLCWRRRCLLGCTGCRSSGARP